MNLNEELRAMWSYVLRMIRLPLPDKPEPPPRTGVREPRRPNPGPGSLDAALDEPKELTE